MSTVNLSICNSLSLLSSQIFQVLLGAEPTETALMHFQSFAVLKKLKTWDSSLTTLEAWILWFDFEHALYYKT